MAKSKDKETVFNELHYKLDGCFEWEVPTYRNTHSHVILTCLICGEKVSMPITRILSKDKNWYKCKNCDKINRLKDLINYCIDIHKDRKYTYDFDKNYELYYSNNNNNKRLTVNCPIHGEFEVFASAHKQGKMICPKCNDKHKKYIRRIDTNFVNKTFIEKCQNIFGNNIYDYSKVEYINNDTEVDIHCNIHNIDFKIKPHNILRCHSGCYLCVKEKNINNKKLNINEYIEKCKNVHQNKYVYDDKLNYKNLKSDIYPLCTIHGRFRCNAGSHLIGYGYCPKCVPDKTYQEELLFLKIKEHFKDAVRHYKTKVIGNKHIDIFIPSLNVGIEYQGLQHFKPIDFYGGEETFQKQLKRDLDKINQCKENGIILFHYTNEKIDNNYPYYCFNNVNELIQYILKQQIKKSLTNLIG